MQKIALILATLLLFPSVATAQSERFFYNGDGQLSIKGGMGKLSGLSPRLIALLDHLQDNLTDGKGRIEIRSGFRSFRFNEGLRRRGLPAGRASLHMEGMAADFVLNGVSPKQVWEYIRGLNCCGTGFYHGKAVHIDTGPSRFWDEKTSKVKTDISIHNKLIYLTTDYDRYRPGEVLRFKAVRITEYPFTIKNGLIIEAGGKKWAEVKMENRPECIRVSRREEAQNFSFVLPEEAPPEGKKLTLRAAFYEKPSPEMPDIAASNPFMIDQKAPDTLR